MKFDRCYGCMEKISAYPCKTCGYDPEKETIPPFVLHPGTILKGQYLLGRVLGQGGFGITYVGWDLALEKKVALKEYFPASYAGRDAGSDSVHWYATEQAQFARRDGMEMFLKEARKMSRVSSIANVVHVQDLFQQNNTAYIVMEFVEGQTLKTWVKTQGPLEWKQAQRYFLPVIETMAQVHAAGLIHRDLSPDNVMIQPDGGVRILDLGAAKDLNINSGNSSMQVAKGGFSPLEQYTQRGGSGTWTDVYALAATLYAAVTGVVPPSAIERMSKDNLNFNLPALKKLPGRVVKALRHALMVRPEERTQTMEAFALELSGKQKIGAKGRGRKAAVAAGLSAAVLALALLAFPRETAPGPEAPATTQPPAAPEQTEPTQPQAPWEGNVLKMDPVRLESGFDQVYDLPVRKEQIVSVTFLDTVAGAPGESCDVSQAGDGTVLAWTTGSGDRQNLFLAGEGGVNGVNCRNLFAYYINLESIAFNGALHTEYAWNLSGMFDNCLALTTLDLSSLDTSSMTIPMDFSTCVSLQELNLRGLDTSRLTSLNGMFSGCRSLQSLDLSGFDTANVTDMGWMFAGCESLTQVDLTGFDTSRVEDMSKMFSGCASLQQLDVSSFDTSSVTRMVRMFENCENLKTVDFSGFDVRRVVDYSGFMNGGQTVGGKSWHYIFKPEARQPVQTPVESAQHPWAGNVLMSDPGTSAASALYGSVQYQRGQVVSVRFLDTLSQAPATAWDVSQGQDHSVLAWVEPASPRGYQLLLAAEGGINGVASARDLFRYYENLQTVEFSGNYHTEQATDFRYLFAGCTSLTQADVQTLDTANGTNFRGMFQGCESLEEVNLENFHTAKAVDMVNLFQDCRSLRQLDLSAFQTGGLTSLEGMFRGCESLSQLDLSSFDTSSVRSMSHLFRDCRSLESVNLTGFDTAAVEDMRCLFAGCSALQQADISGFDLSRTVNVGSMFAGCSQLTLPQMDFSQLADAYWVGFLDEDVRIDGEPWQTVFVSRQTQQQEDNRWENNVMKRIFQGYRLSGEDKLFLGTDITRKEIASVTFLDTLENAPEASWDFSQAGDRSVLAWTTFGGDGMHHLYIAGEGGVNGREAGYMLFNNYVNMTQVHFNGNFHTEQATNISGMLHNCSSLIYVDANTLDAGSVTDMSSVFNGCESLRQVDISGWDTASAQRMNYLFWECRSLEQVTLGNLDTSQVEDMQGMFCRCNSLKSVDVSGFNTSRVANMSEMFRECTELRTLDLSNFDTARAERFDNFAEHTCIVNGGSWRELFT